MSSEKIKEGDAYFASGTKAIQQPWLPWQKPDYDTGAAHFDKAALSYKIGKSYQKAFDAYSKAHLCHVKCDITFSAGKALEGCGDMLVKLKKLPEAKDHYLRAADFFNDGEAPDKASQVLIRAAKYFFINIDIFLRLFPKNPEEAIPLLQKGIEYLMEAEKGGQAVKLYRQIINISALNKMFDKCSEALEAVIQVFKDLSQPHNIYKMVTSQIIIDLASKDFVAAERDFAEGCKEQGFAFSPEGKLSAELLDSFQNADNNKLTTALSNHERTTLGFLERGIANLTRELSIEAGEMYISAIPTITADSTLPKLTVGKPKKPAEEDSSSDIFASTSEPELDREPDFTSDFLEPEAPPEDDDDSLPTSTSSSHQEEEEPVTTLDEPDFC